MEISKQAFTGTLSKYPARKQEVKRDTALQLAALGAATYGINKFSKSPATEGIRNVILSGFNKVKTFLGTQNGKVQEGLNGIKSVLSNISTNTKFGQFVVENAKKAKIVIKSVAEYTKLDQVFNTAKNFVAENGNKLLGFVKNSPLKAGLIVAAALIVAGHLFRLGQAKGRTEGEVAGASNALKTVDKADKTCKESEDLIKYMGQQDEAMKSIYDAVMNSYNKEANPTQN